MTFLFIKPAFSRTSVVGAMALHGRPPGRRQEEALSSHQIGGRRNGLETRVPFAKVRYGLSQRLRLLASELDIWEGLLPVALF